MWIVFEPVNSDLEEVAIPYGPNLVKMKRGEPRDLADPIAKRMLEHSPELYQKADAPAVAATPEIKAEAPAQPAN